MMKTLSNSNDFGDTPKIPNFVGNDQLAPLLPSIP